ncbi:two-component system chemotaxis response regulator CheB [Filimonas zeae]|nr:chemotaxis protein CheB [Filimonas zeae]MDR6338584.1 two-component system chemotaxis response regulator CheB [Filimonas zeae]
MIQKPAENLLVVGGSAGSLPIIMSLIENLPDGFNWPVIVVLHRLKNVNSELVKLLAGVKNGRRVCEPEDKTQLRDKYIYLAPQNYHVLLEADKTISLDYSEPVHFSRPSIDVTFEAAAHVYGNKAAGILLSGANNDGAYGLEQIWRAGGSVAVQDPETCEYAAMPLAAIHRIREVLILQPAVLALFLENLLLNK